MDSLSEAEIYLVERDEILSSYIVSQGHIERRAERAYFEALASSIISQQISVKAAAKIFARFKDATGLIPEKAVNLNEEQIKTIGLSNQKSRYINDLARHFVEDSAVFDHLNSLSDDEIIAELTKVKGIGVWTAQMFLMFTLNRPDIIAPDDRGLQLAIENIYQHSEPLKRSELTEFAERWSPYRTTACLHLWKSLDNTPV